MLMTLMLNRERIAIFFFPNIEDKFSLKFQVFDHSNFGTPFLYFSKISLFFYLCVFNNFTDKTESEREARDIPGHNALDLKG